MRQIKPFVLALAAVCALLWIGASSATAAQQCSRVAEPGTGNFNTRNCSGTPAAGGSYIRVNEPGMAQASGIWCTQTVEPNTGNFLDNLCSNRGIGSFIRVYDRPAWWHGGAPLESTRQITLQLKGKAALEGKIALMAVKIECSKGESEGATIEAGGLNQGQDKGRIKFATCELSGIPKSKCVVEEPITTVQTKSVLGNTTGQAKYVDLYMPQQGTTFANIKITKGVESCALAGEFPVKGTAAALLIPGEAEVQEGLVVFPTTAVGKVLLAEQEVEPKLTLGTEAAKFSASFSAKLATGESYGVFGSN